MHFEWEQCAVCGIHNTSFYAPTDKYPSYPQPQFCSERCFKSAVSRFLPADFVHPDNVELTEYDQSLLDRVNNADLEDDSDYTLRATLLAQFDRKKDALRDKAKDQLADAYATYAKAWNAALDQKKQDVKDKEAAKWEAQKAEWRAQGVEYLAEQKRMAELIRPRDIPQDKRYEHTHILGPSGSGKTTLIEKLILDDLETDNPPAYIIIDPKGLMVERISRLDVFNPDTGRLRDRLIIIDPTTEPPPALNLFQSTGLKHTEAHAISTFAYIFSSSKTAFTTKQSTAFAFVARLLFTVPGADLMTLMDLLDDDRKDSKFSAAIAALTEPAAKRFFEKDYYTSNYNETRQQIKARLYEIIKDPYLSAMFNAPERKLDLFDCIQKRKIVLVNTALNVLREAHQTIGRFIIAMAVNAAMARTSVPKSEWSPAFLVIDEFQEFADEQKTPEMLRLVREYNMGIVLAHHNMYCIEFDDAIRSAISTNTSIKYATNPEAQDINYMARDMRCEGSFLTSQTKTATEAKFACYVRGMGLTHPFVASVPFGAVDRAKKMSPEALKRLLQRNTALLAATPPKAPEKPPQPRIEPPVPTPTPVDASESGDTL